MAARNALNEPLLARVRAAASLSTPPLLEFARALARFPKFVDGPAAASLLAAGADASVAALLRAFFAPPAPARARL